MINRLSIATIFVLLIIFNNNLLSAPLYFFPAELTQPDGTVIHVFLTGDEYYNWVHDANDFTIIQDQNTGYYVYADIINDELVPTGLIVGRDDPSSGSLISGLNISGEKMRAKRNEFLSISPSDMGDAPTTGTINNLVIYIRFSGETEFTDTKIKYDTIFNNSTSGANSMYNYFKEVSYNSLAITSTFYPVTAGATVISYQDANPRNYYKPYSTTNTIGYTGGNNGTERTTREHTLLKNAVNYVASQVPVGLNLDGDNDGKVDNVCFIVYGSPGAWADLLWPHRWALYSYTVNINGKRVYDYNFQLQTSLSSSGVGVLCHEMFHSLGSPDLYHYTSNGITPVGSWDVMQSNTNPPQHMGAYMKYRYGHWISSIPVITDGVFTLNPITSSSGNCYRINSPVSSTEYYVVEYRRKLGTFDGSIPGTGLLVYRINTAVDGQGNADGPPDEVYIYRPNGTLTVNGSISSAHYSSNVGRTSINDATNPAPFLSTGNPGGLDLYNVGSSGETISFSVGTVAAPNAITTLAVLDPTSNKLTLSWTVPSGVVSGYDIRYSTSPITDLTTFLNAAQLPFTGTPGVTGSVETYPVQSLSSGTTYYFNIRSRNLPDNWSALSNPAEGTTWLAPQIAVNPLSITNVLQPDVVFIDTVQVFNLRATPSTLDFNISMVNDNIPEGIFKAVVIPMSNVSEEFQGGKGYESEGNGVSIDGSGGPDAFGYEWIDSNEPGGPAYIWEDISLTGILVSDWIPNSSYDARDEGYTGPFNIGFNFEFYGNLKNQVYISSNGLLTFAPIPTNIASNTSIPNSNAPNEFIAPFWDDLDGSENGAVYYKQDGSRFIVQFSNWPRYGQTSSSLTFQVILNANGSILYYYNNMNSTILNSGTVGIENSAGTTGLQVVYNASYIGNGLAVKISEHPDWISNNVSSGTIYSGNYVNIILTFTSAGMPLGNYNLNLMVSSNDPVNPLITIPVTMQIQNTVMLSSLKVLFEGLYDGTNMIADTAAVELHNISPPYSLVDQIMVPLDASGSGSGAFSEAMNGSSYYIVVKHRNGLETWSASGQTVVSNILNYDFTTSDTKAYGNNLVLKGTKWCIYSGDLNNDGFINADDLNSAGTAAGTFQTGYVLEDLNGDNIVDLQDLLIIDNNKNNNVGVISP